MFTLFEKIDPGRQEERMDPGRGERVDHDDDPGGHTEEYRDPGGAAEKAAEETANTTKTFRASCEMVLTGGGKNYSGSLGTIKVGESLRMKYDMTGGEYGIFIGETVQAIMDRGSGNVQVITQGHSYQLSQANAA